MLPSSLLPLVFVKYQTSTILKIRFMIGKHRLLPFSYNNKLYRTIHKINK